MVHNGIMGQGEGVGSHVKMRKGDKQVTALEQRGKIR